MKLKTLAVAAGVSVPFILGGSASAGFVGITTTSKPNDFDLFTVNVYAIFDRPDPGDGSGDHMVGVFGTPEAPLTVKVHDGVFYNSPFGNDTIPSAAFINAFPSLAYDTFVTIGRKETPSGPLVLLKGFPVGITGSIFAMITSGWFVPPDVPQGDPFNPPDSFPGNGQIIIGQFSTAEGFRIEGKMLLQYISNGVSEQTYVGFCQDRFVGQCPVCEGDCGNFDGDVGIVDLLALLSEWGTASTCDIDGGGVGITDFLILLVNWGPCLPLPTGACCLPGDICEQRTLQSCNAGGGAWQLAETSCEDYFGGSSICTDVCPWDCSGADGTVDFSDLVALLNQWGQIGFCDLGLGDPGGGLHDLLSMLANWGPCP